MSEPTAHYERCVFCLIVNGDAPATVVREFADAVAVVPLNPVTPGHVLVISRDHVADFTENPQATEATMGAAALLAESPCNLITSAGAEATQTVFHLHVHVVPRRAVDGLTLPWTAHNDGSPS